MDWREGPFKTNLAECTIAYEGEGKDEKRGRDGMLGKLGRAVGRWELQLCASHGSWR
jgi:hypothetical protein